MDTSCFKPCSSLLLHLFNTRTSGSGSPSLSINDFLHKLCKTRNVSCLPSINVIQYVRACSRVSVLFCVSVCTRYICLVLVANATCLFDSADPDLFVTSQFATSQLSCTCARHREQLLEIKLCTIKKLGRLVVNFEPDTDRHRSQPLNRAELTDEHKRTTSSKHPRALDPRLRTSHVSARAQV